MVGRPTYSEPIQTYSFNSSKVSIRLNDDIRLRNGFNEIQHQRTFYRSVSASPDRTSFKFNVEDFRLEHVNITKRGYGFSIGFRERQVNKGISFARKLSSASDPKQFLALQKGKSIDTYHVLHSGEQYLVKLKGKNTWMEVRLSKQASPALSNTWYGQAVGFNSKSKVAVYKFHTPEQAKEIAKLHKITLSSPKLERNTQLNTLYEGFRGDKHGSITKHVLAQNNPHMIKQRLNQDYRYKIGQVDQAIRGNSHDIDGLKIVDELIQIHGEKPNLLFRRGLLRFNAQNKSRQQLGTYELNHAILKGKNKDFYKEVDKLLQHPGVMKPADQKLLRKYSGFQLGKTNCIIAKVHPPEQAVKTSFSEVAPKLESGKGRLIIQDNPKLNALDWNTSPTQTLHNVLESYPNAVLYRLPRHSLQNYRFGSSIELAYHIGSKESSLVISFSFQAARA
jgi:hypothetical protein